MLRLELVRKVKYAVLTQEFAEMITGIKVDFQDPSTLVNLFMSSISFLVATLGFSMFDIMSSAVNVSFYSSYLFKVVLSCCLIAMARTCNTVL